MNPAFNESQNVSKYYPKKDIVLNTIEQSFQKKFKLTEKIQKLSSSPIYERAPSPWNRKRNQSLAKSIQFVQQSSSPTNRQAEGPVVSNRQQPNITHETNMNDFLRKIQFTKRKQSVTTSNFSPDKNELNPSLEKSPNQKNSQRQTDTRLEQMRQLIIFPKEVSIVKQSNHLHNQSTIKKHKKKQYSDTMIATVQNFYDPFQHKTQQSLKYNIPKGMVKFKLRIQNELSCNKTAPFTQPSSMGVEMQKTFRNESVEEQSHRENINLSETQRSLLGQQQDFIFKSNQLMLNSTQRTFLKTHKRNFSRKSVTEGTQESIQMQNNIHQRTKSSDMPTFVTPQLTYASPTGQAIRRIKIQHKRSRKMKTEVKQSVQKVDVSSGNSMTKDDKEYLYKTFLNYKTQKNSSDHNITKTLNLTFHNKETFQKNIQKALYTKAK